MTCCILIGQHTESAALRLYEFADEQSAAEALEKRGAGGAAGDALWAHTPWSTSPMSASRSVATMRATLQIGYRRTEEQMQRMVNATSSAALTDLLEAALDGDREELVVRIGYWQADGRERVAETVEALRQERGISEEEPWIVRYYPQSDPVGIIEFLLQPTEEELAAYQEEQVHPGSGTGRRRRRDAGIKKCAGSIDKGRKVC